MTSKTPGGTAEPTSKTQGCDTNGAPGVLEYLDPTGLLIETNVRSDLHLTGEFVASIKAHGVLVPVVAVRTDQGVRVRAGQRRTAAAVEAGLTSIPVMVLNPAGTDADRIVEQLTENIHRTALTDSDTVGAVEQLALLGCSAATIAKRTKLPRQRVDQALIVSESASRGTLTADIGLNLEHAAWLAEFEDDHEVYEQLRDEFLAEPEQARHAVERERQNRRWADALAQAVATVGAQNNGILYDGPTYGPECKAARLEELLTASGGEELTPEAHAWCRGKAFRLRRQSWGTPDLIIDGCGFGLEHWCTDWKGNGHADRYANPDNPSKPDAGTDEAKEQRRQTIALNKAGEAAKTVREEWLTAFTTDGRSGKHLPTLWPRFMLDTLEATYTAGDDKAYGLPHVLELLHINDLDNTALSDNTINHVLLCARLWSFERMASREIWRQTSTHRLYLDYLQSWGYTLSPAEKCGAGHIDQDKAYASLTAAEASQ